MKNDKKVEGSFSNVVTVKESSLKSLPKTLSFEMTFFNNQGRDLSLYTDREFARITKDQLWAFVVKDVMTFFWHSGTLSLEYIKHDSFTEELLEYWCLHVVLPIFLTIEETYDFLHAGAVEVKGKPILFVAESFGGKSTMTDFFMKQGHTLISDDKVAVYEKDNEFFSIPSHPHHRPYRKMEDLGYFVKNLSTKPRPIHVVYELEKVEMDEKIVIAELNGMEKFILLKHSSEINIPFLKSKRFEFLTKMANNVRVYKVSVPWNLERLTEVYKYTVEHISQLKERI